MHHFIFPSQDTYITDKTSYPNKNFGLDEMLIVGTTNVSTKITNATKTYSYATQTVANLHVEGFTGTIHTASLCGTATNITGTIVQSGSYIAFSSSYFSGNISGSYNGWIAGTASTGSVSGSLTPFSGSISASIVIGTVTGSLKIQGGFYYFDGQITGSNGEIITGSIYGTDTVNQQNITTQYQKYSQRALIKFDVSAISNSIVSGDITSPNFVLSLKVAREEELPIQYSVYAFPISQSWEMGNGYWSDEGSDEGASWNYRNEYLGNLWYAITSSVTSSVDFVTYPWRASETWPAGGGTWHTSPICSQSFDYESSDISMDITPIVNKWLDKSIPNEGVILISSDEFQSTGSQMALYFFSKDTNTIYQPYLDAAWDDTSWVTGSISTSSVVISTITSSISATIQSGSSLTIAGGISGMFTGSSFVNLTPYYVTASNSVVNASLQNFSGSFTGSLTANSLTYVNGFISGSTNIYTASYFSGSVDNAPISQSNNLTVSGSYVNGIITGSSVITASISHFEGTVVTALGTNYPATINGTILTGSYLDPLNNTFYGFINGLGFTGNIAGIPVIGGVLGTVSTTETLVTGPCGASFNAYLATGSFTTGIFSGSTFTAYYVDYKFENAILTGSWTGAALLGARVYIPIPSGIEPYYYADVNGVYVRGKAIGTYTISGSNSGSGGSNSASFSGQFVNGNLLGGILSLQLSGSVYTSSYSYTGSVVMTSSYLSAVDVNTPFVSIVQNIPHTVKANNIIRINVFGREQFPLKNFNKQTQFSQYLIPKYLPTSSYYAIKDTSTEEIVLDFDNYTKMSCDTTGNYFLLDTTGFAQERYYRILIKVEQSGSIYTFDGGNIFKITR